MAIVFPFAPLNYVTIQFFTSFCLSQNRVQMPYPIVGFVDRMLLLSKNRRWLLSLRSKIINICALFGLHTCLKNTSQFLKVFFRKPIVHKNVLSLPVNSSISSKHVLLVLSDFGSRKKKITRNLTPPVQSIFPTPLKQSSSYPTREGLLVTIPTPPGGCLSFDLIDA